MKNFKIICIGWAAVLSVALCGLSEARNVTYLPRDQEMQAVSQNYNGSGYKLGELSCTAATGADALDRSMACVGARLDCPDCCLDWTHLDANGRPTMKSTPMVTITTPPAFPYYNQTEILFNSSDGSDSNVCSAVRNCTNGNVNVDPVIYPRPPFRQTGCATLPLQEISHCQERGCPGVDLNLYINAQPFLLNPVHKCEQVGATPDKWLCDTTIQHKPAFDGCEPLSADYACSGPVYTITTAPCDPAWGFPATHVCSYYEFTSAYRDCINKCITGAQGFERYERDTDCLLHGDAVCPTGTSGPGFVQNCVSYQCQQRIDWPECKPPLGSSTNALCCDNEALDAAKIKEYQDSYNKCFDREMRDGGGCLDCFQPLGTKTKPFQYDFIARSGQKMVVIWQLQVTPHYCLTPNDTCPDAHHWDVGPVPTSYVYTTAKVFDITNGNETEVFPGTTTKGTLSQRAFAGAFSIFAATAVNKKDDEKTSFLEQGHRYRVKLYWYIPSISSAILSADVLWAQLTVIKTRE